LVLFDFIDLDSSYKDDITYNKIVRNWNGCIDYLPSEEDKQLLLLGVMSKRYFKYQKSKGLWNLIMNFPMDSNVDVNRPTYPN
jgi:hypothetical protein